MNCNSCQTENEIKNENGILVEGLDTRTEEKVKPVKKKGLARAIIALIFDIPAALAAVFSLSLAFSAIESTQIGGWSGIGAAFALVFLIIFGFAGLIASVIAFILSLLAVLRYFKLKKSQLAKPKATIIVGSIALGISVVSIAVTVLAFILGFSI